MKRDLTVPLALAVMLLPTLAHAYIGPGAGVSAIGAALALVAAVFFAIVGFVWYPVKRLMRKRKAAAEQASDTPPSAE
ncbi:MULTISPECIES: hypothetical protein [unclassified Meridianimarinicoccus]|uniref:hypothetical protein n=1 Tax=unclassified Meridianimarinicoccus TaxID=2923344 RepID=UPI0018660411|nr:hypothetical protein [Fluviibacterium sp. MJW13]